ncbi:MAG: hypothetical protein AB8F74_15395 [Saprospiraceae bacterium]
MQQRNNLKDQIDQISKNLVIVSALFRGLKNRGSLEDAVSQTNLKLHEKLGFNVSQFISYSKEETIDYAQHTLKSIGHMEFIADYLTELGDWKLNSNRSEALKYYQQSRILYELISSQSRPFDFHRSKKEYALILRIEKLENAS